MNNRQFVVLITMLEILCFFGLSITCKLLGGLYSVIVMSIGIVCMIVMFIFWILKIFFNTEKQ